MNGLMYEWMRRWMSGWIDGFMEGLMYLCIQLIRIKICHVLRT